MGWDGVVGRFEGVRGSDFRCILRLVGWLVVLRRYWTWGFELEVGVFGCGWLWVYVG